MIFRSSSSIPMMSLYILLFHQENRLASPLKFKGLAEYGFYELEVELLLS